MFLIFFYSYIQSSYTYHAGQHPVTCGHPKRSLLEPNTSHSIPDLSHFCLLVSSVHILLGECISRSVLGHVETFLDTFYAEMTTHYGMLHVVSACQPCTGKLKPCKSGACTSLKPLPGHLHSLLALASVPLWQARILSIQKYKCHNFCPKGSATATIKVHLLSHVVQCVRLWGPIWCYSCYQFEGMNHEITRLFHGSRNMSLKVTQYYTKSQYLPFLGCLFLACIQPYYATSSTRDYFSERGRMS